MKTIIVLPAYNAAETLQKTVSDIPADFECSILLVDDGSSDETVTVARELGLEVVLHDKNRGYGANQKTCYTEALKRGADIIVMLHPDYQYDPKIIPYMVGLIQDGYLDVVLGSRIRSRKESLAGGMPLYKYVSNRALSLFENIVAGQNLSEWHTGMRAYTKEVLVSIDYANNSDDFVFDSEVLFQIIEKGFTIGEISVPVRYFPEASSINLKRSIRYGLGTVWTALKYLGRRLAS